MKISKNQVKSVLKAYSVNKIENKTKKQKQKELGKDKLELSSKAKNYKTAYKSIKKAPDIRKDKVEALKKQIKEGTYNVDGEKVAQKILERLVVDELV